MNHQRAIGLLPIGNRPTPQLAVGLHPMNYQRALGLQSTGTRPTPPETLTLFKKKSSFAVWTAAFLLSAVVVYFEMGYITTPMPSGTWFKTKTKRCFNPSDAIKRFSDNYVLEKVRPNRTFFQRFGSAHRTLKKVVRSTPDAQHTVLVQAKFS